jgi:hypothetical protein
MIDSCKWLIKRFVFIITALSIIGCGVVSDIEKNNIQRVKHINSIEVAKVTIFETMRNYKSKKKMIKVLEENSEISEFIGSLRKMKRVHLNHPDFPNGWSVEIEFKDKKQEKEKLNILQRTGFEGRLYIECLGHRWLGGAAKAVSFDLYDWMNKSIGGPAGRP